MCIYTLGQNGGNITFLSKKLILAYFQPVVFNEVAYLLAMDILVKSFQVLYMWQSSIEILTIPSCK